MSNKVKAKVIKNKKKFPWGKVFYYFKSLFSNAVCLDIATSLKWFWGIIVFVFALLVSVVQPTVTNSQLHGGTIINSTSSDALVYGLNDYYVRTTDKENVEEAGKYKITFDSKTKELLGTYQHETFTDYVVNGDTATAVVKPSFTTYRNGERIFDIYISTTYGDEQKFLSNIVGSNPIYGDASAEERKVIDTNGKKYTRSTSCIIFTKSSIYVLLCDTLGAQSAQLSGNYKYILEAFPELATNGSYTLTEILGYGLTTDSASVVRDTIIKNAATYFDKVYVDPVWNQTWVTFGIYCGVNGGIMIIMAFIVFAMTRGKNNPNRSIKLLQCFSISFWFAITPALLTLTLGFAFPQFGPMLFLMTYSFRIMFLSMKYLRPSYQ